MPALPWSAPRPSLRCGVFKMAVKSGASLNWGGLDKRLGKLAEIMAKRQAMLSAVGEALVSSTNQRFQDGKGPDGKTWEPSARAWEDGVDDGGFGKTLADTGRLMHSIDYATTPDSVMVGSNVAYARIHQMGGKAGRGRKVSIPARPYLGVSEEDKEEVQTIIADFMRGKN